LLDWLLLREELAQAKGHVAVVTLDRAEFVRRAERAFELAERAERDRPHVGSSTALALDLFRQSIYWALRAQSGTPEQASIEAVWFAAEGAGLVGASAQAVELAEVSNAVRSNFVELAEGAAERQRELAKLLRRHARRLIRDAQAPQSQLEWTQLKRTSRLLLLALSVCLPIAAVFIWKNRDLARGVPWRTSSVEMECHPERSECGGASTNILFHTKFEDSPWFEYDFGKPLDFSSVTIRNRTDYRPELAVPLVIEASDDHKNYRELARRKEVFQTWHTSFAPQRARYLRVRALNKTFLHLETVKVQP
jgi:hypothetical protein